MKLESSLCVNEDIKNEIISASKHLNISANSLINMLIRKAININNDAYFKNRLVEYQNSHLQLKNVIFRYRKSYAENEFYNSARNRLKISISMLLLVGFLLFFKKIINKLNKGKNNISTTNYTTLYIVLVPIITSFIKRIENSTKKLE